MSVSAVSLTLPLLRSSCGDVRKVTSLSLAEKNLADLEALRLLPRPAQVVSLIAPGNCLVHVDELAALSSLRVLDLHGNKLSSIRGIAGLSGLRELDVSDNPSLASTGLVHLAGLTSLSRLGLSGLPRVVVPLPIFGLRSLVSLSMSRCALDRAPALSGLINLRELDLSHNVISSVGTAIDGLKLLTKLNVSWNPLYEVPVSPALKELDIRGTCIGVAPESREGLVVLWEAPKVGEDTKNGPNKKRKKKKRKVDAQNHAVEAIGQPSTEVPAQQEDKKKEKEKKETKEKKHRAEKSQTSKKKKSKKIKNAPKTDEESVAKYLAPKKIESW